MQLRERFAAPDAGLIAGIALVQVVCIAVPNFFSVAAAAVTSCGLLVAGYVLFSPQRTLLVALVLNIALPVKVLFSMALPGGLRLQEAVVLALPINWLTRRSRRCRRLSPPASSSRSSSIRSNASISSSPTNRPAINISLASPTSPID